MEEEEIGLFEFEWEQDLDDELQELERYMFGKVTSAVENRILQKHAGQPTDETTAQLRRMAARYQRGELGKLLPVLIPFMGGGQKKLAEDFFSTIEEQPDENVFIVYRLASGWASDLGFPLPKDAPPLDEQPMDLIEIGETWPEMSSIAIH